MINEESKEYKRFKELGDRSYFIQKDGYRSLYKDVNGKRIGIQSIAIKEFGEIQYLSWIEEHNRDNYLLSVLQLEPNRELHLKYYLTPQDGYCIFWEHKWTDEGLFLIYHDEQTNYALKATFDKNPIRLQVQVSELGEKIVIKKNWIIGFQNFSQLDTVKLFDLKSFEVKGVISIDESVKQEIVPDEQNIYGEELE